MNKETVDKFRTTMTAIAAQVGLSISSLPPDKQDLMQGYLTNIEDNVRNLCEELLNFELTGGDNLRELLGQIDTSKSPWKEA